MLQLLHKIGFIIRMTDAFGVHFPPLVGGGLSPVFNAFNLGYSALLHFLHSAGKIQQIVRNFDFGFIIRMTDAFGVHFPPLVGGGLCPVFNAFNLGYSALLHFLHSAGKVQQIVRNFVNVPAASRCCPSSEDTHITMQAAYGRALCLRKGRSYLLSF